MDLNAYVLAMAIVAGPRHQKKRQIVAKPEFKPFDLRYLRDLRVNSSQARHISCQEKAQNNVSEVLSV